LSHLWLDPGRVIYAVVQAFYFYCQTYDWWPRRFTIRRSLFPREILMWLRWFAAILW
jgi:hypothetical protein